MKAVDMKELLEGLGMSTELVNQLFQEQRTINVEDVRHALSVDDAVVDWYSLIQEEIRKTELTDWFLAVPFGACDALFSESWIMFSSRINERFTIRRQPLSSGSTVFNVSLDKIYIGLVEFTQISSELTRIQIMAGEAGEDSAETGNVYYNILFKSLQRFAAYYLGLRKRAQAEVGWMAFVPELESLFLSEEELPRRPQHKKAPGAKQEHFNRQAREAIEQGEDRKTVFRKWAREKKYNLSNPEDRDRADAAFRRMLSRKPKKVT